MKPFDEHGVFRPTTDGDGLRRLAIRGAGNASENSDVSTECMALYSKALRPVHDYRVNKTRWCVLRWTTPSMAQTSEMSTGVF